LDQRTLLAILLGGPVLILSVVAHEVAHGYVALREGDPTARDLGRLTLNPLKHIDPFMTIVLPVMLLISSHGRMALGGARPVPVNPRNYRRGRRSDILVSLAGVVVNFGLALLSIIGFVAAGFVGQHVTALLAPMAVVQQMALFGLLFNLLLFSFNLIPIPPLDGSHVAKYLLPPAWAAAYQRFARYGIIALVVVIFFGGRFLAYWFWPTDQLATLLLSLASPFSLGSL
jgi:Zn-dependent protease